MLDTIPFTSVHSNLECGLAILTESFSLLRSVLHNLSCWSPKQKWCDNPCYSWYCLLDMCEKPVQTSSPLIKLATGTKVDVIAKRQCLVENSISWWSKGQWWCQISICLAARTRNPCNFSFDEILVEIPFEFFNVQNWCNTALKLDLVYITLVYVTAP